MSQRDTTGRAKAPGVRTAFQYHPYRRPERRPRHCLAWQGRYRTRCSYGLAMTAVRTRGLRVSAAVAWRVSVTLVSIVIVEAVVCAAATLPVVAFWSALMAWTSADALVRTVAFSVLLVPSYIAFALCLMVATAAANRITGARTLPDRTMPISEMEWPLMRWARYMVASHIVRVLAGALFRGSPIWTAYLRMNGAKIGKRVYVNSLFVSDHNLLEFGND